MSKSRTENTVRNVKTGFIVQLINKLMAFVVRTIFIKCLNSDYLGINGLFTNVLTILSFAELGIGTAIIFSMYKPVAEDDKEKIKSYMYLYKKSYNVIGISVFLLGLLVIPFMNIIIKDAPNISENIILIYLLFLINTSSSYFFTYKKSIIIAHQKQSVINNIDSIFYILKSIIEIIFLILTRNFIIYLIIQIGGTIIENFYISHIANKMYPYLKEKKIKKLNKKESKNIFSNVKSLVIYKFGGVIMNGTDNILISALINVTTVGIVSNYNLIIQSIKAIFSSALNGVTASVGNLNAIGNKEQKEKTYYDLTFIYYLVYSFSSIALIILLNPFIKIWLGTDYILGISISIALSVSFFIEGMRQTGYIYRTTLGLFQKAQITPYIGAITNIVLSIILCKIWGVVGIFIATSIAQLVSYSWIDTYLIYKYEFKKKSNKFYKKYIIYFVTFTLELLLTLLICNFIKTNSIIELILKGIVALIIPNTLNFIIFKNSTEYNTINKKVIKPIIKKLSKLKRFKKYTLIILTLLSELITILFTIKLNMLPTKYLLLLILIETILSLLCIIQLKKKLKIIGIIISVLTIITNILGIYYISNTNKFIDKSFTGDIKYTSIYYIITSQDNENGSLDNIKNIKYYKYSYNIEEAKNKLGEYNYEEIDNIENTLKNINNDYLLIDENNYKLLNKPYKIIYEFNLEKIEKKKEEKLDSYNIYIAGRDFTRTLADFNMIVTINNKTKTILLTSIPRDYYMIIPEYNMYDSLEFMGVLGNNAMISSLENLLDTKIDYNVSIYTEGLVEITDLLGGIDFCSDITFTTTHAQVQDTYDDSYGEKLTVYKGCQHLNGIQTLTVARERKNIGSDRKRQENCRQILKSILNKTLSTTTLTNYQELLNTVSGLYETNINKETIQSLIKNLINNNYKIEEQSVNGYDSDGYIRLGTIKSYVMIPDNNSVEQAKQKIKQVLSN